MTESVVTTGAIRRAKLQSNRHQQHTNTQLFTGWMPFLYPNQQCGSTEGNRFCDDVLYKFVIATDSDNDTIRHPHIPVSVYSRGWRVDPRAVCVFRT